MSNYTFTGNEGEPIALETAQMWTANYRASAPGETKAHFFGHTIIEKILREQGCLGIRIYYALNDQGEKQLILTGADAAGENLLPATPQFDPADPHTLADASYPCPSFCPTVDL